jgi:DNA polymerase-1
MSLQEATKFRDKFFKTYSYLPLWHKRQIRLVRNNGYVTNLFGRIRHLPEIYSFDFKERAGAERKSINSPVQSLASDLLIMSGIDLYNLLYKTGYFYIVGTIHDALLMEVKTSKLDSILPQIKKTMENPPSLKKLGVKFSVPIIVDIALGSWGSGKKWSEK